MSSDAFEVPPLSRKNIRAYADRIRHTFKITSPCFPIVEFVEFALPQVFDDFYFDVCDKEEMTRRFGKGCHGMTYPDDRDMHIREDIYERARRGEGRDRLTLAHEVAHLLLHADLGYKRRISDNTPAYSNSEWQANVFGGELLVSYRHIKTCQSIDEAADLFKVSLDAAKVQWGIFEKDRIIK